MKHTFVKNIELNQLLWTIISKDQLTRLPYPRNFLSLRLTDFSLPDEATGNRMEDCFRLLGREGCATYELDRNRVPTLLPPFDIAKIEKMADTNLDHFLLDHFIQGIKKWNTPQARPVDEICYTAFCVSASREGLKAIKKELSDVGLIIIDSSKSYVPDDYFVRGIIVDSPSDYARRLFDIPIFNVKNPESGLYVTYPDIYILQPNDQDTDQDHNR